MREHVSVSADDGRDRRSEQAHLHRAMRDAAKVLGLSDSVAITAAALIAFIPIDAPAPISPVEVQRLADDRGLDVRTIRNHIGTLITTGIASDCTQDRGRRRVRRGPDGRIVVLEGISFGPLAARAEDLAVKAAEINAMAAEKARFRGLISSLRRRIKGLLASDVATDTDRAVFAGLPRRIAHLDLDALVRLWSAVQDLHDVLFSRVVESQTMNVNDASAVDATAMTPEKESDRSDSPCRRTYITTGQTLKPCNLNDQALQKERREERSTLHDRQIRCGLQHVRLDMAVAAAPPDWQRELERAGRPSWSALAATAYGRAGRLGINRMALDVAHAAIGKPGVALLILIADQNRDTIRNPGAWLRSMAGRAERGEAYIHRSIFGILQRQGAMKGASRKC